MFKGLLTDQERELLKNSYDCTLHIYKTTDRKHEVVFKEFTQEMATSFQAINIAANETGRQSDFEMREKMNQYLFDRCVVWPELSPGEKQNLRVGDIPSIAKAIMEKSGYMLTDVLGNYYGPDPVTRKLKEAEHWDPITPEEIEELKACTLMSLYHIKINNYTFVVRPLTRQDFKVITMSGDEALSSVKQVTQWPEDLDWGLIPSGLVLALAQEINMLSGWNISEPEIVEL